MLPTSLPAGICPEPEATRSWPTRTADEALVTIEHDLWIPLPSTDCLAERDPVPAAVLDAVVEESPPGG